MIPRTTWAWFLLLGTACAHRVVMPPPPRTLPRAPDLANTDLYVANFSLEETAIVDGDKESLGLQTAFLKYLAAASQVHSVRPRSQYGALDPESSLVLDVRIRPVHSTGHTLILDAINIFFLGLAVPVWGHATVEVDVTVSDAAGVELARYHRETFDTYWNVLFSWWRTAYVEEAYRDSYEAVFASLAFEMARDSPRLAAAINADIPDIHEQVLSATGDWQTETDGARSWATVWERDLPEPIPRDEQFRLIREAPPGPATTWRQALSLVGGIEAATLYGFARVSSSIEDEDGNAIEVGAGDATQTGYRVALYRAPDSTGWFWYPTVGYLDQSISIGGFRDDLIGNTYGEGIIEPACSDPDTGQVIDCGAPSVYDLEMKSGYLGVRGGYELLAGNKWIQFLASFSVGINLLEYRSLRTVVGDYDGTRETFGGLVSGAAGGTVGLKFPAMHTAIRFIFDYELYRAFEYDRRVPFKGPAVWNSDTGMYERPLRFVTSANLDSWTLQGAVAIVF